ncbi:hypothetical protein PR048_017085 [Dryococelus australis]|uniref:DUF4371 domain-containing protein n=1 Tax=Dryococelus australis TaxID=614101 RepID=A0ABQ9H8R4_9NEOP|nr:hypothetical protein PR048_017085 [Dryococelus australis]
MLGGCGTGVGESRKCPSPAIQNEIIECCNQIILNKAIKEDFLQFFETNSLKGLIQCSIDCEHIFGQGYDGAGNMSDKYNGVKSIIKKIYPKAIYVHCAAHFLNLAITKSIIENSDVFPSARSLKRLYATRWRLKYDAVYYFIELQFHKESLDLKVAVTIAEEAVIKIKSIRGHSEHDFKVVCKQAKSVANSLGVEE